MKNKKANLIERIKSWFHCHFSAWVKLDDGEWHHLATEQKRGKVEKFYLDGQRIFFPANLKMKYSVWKVF